MRRVMISVGGAFLLSVSLGLLGITADAFAQGRNPLIARCTTATGELAITPANRDFCSCLGLKRVPNQKEPYQPLLRQLATAAK